MKVNIIDRKGGSMHKESRVTLGKALKENFDMDTSQKRLKNASDYLKAKYVGCKYLRNKSGNLYNAQTNIGLGSANCSIKWTSTQTTPADTSFSSHRVQRILIEDNPFNGLEDDDDDGNAKAHGGSTYRPDKRAKTTDASTDRSDKRAKTTNASTDRPNKGAKTSDASTDRTDRDKASKSSVSLDELSLDMQKALQHLVNSKEGPIVEECYERSKLVGFDPMDPIFLAAFHLFGMSMNLKEAWMTLSPILEVLEGRGLKRIRDNTSKTSGHQFTLDLLQGTNNQCIELLRMSCDSYVRLCTHFRVKSLLKDSKHILVKKKMAMFLMIIGHNQRYVIIKCRFQHSNQMIHKYFYEVLDKMMVFANDIIVPTSFNPNPNILGHNRRLQRIFKGAVGALDGTLLHVIVPLDKQHLYRGRGKGDCYQNVLVICDFNMIFMFVVVGWEGIAHDSRMFSEALTDRDAPFPFPPTDKYYLFDAAYTHNRGFMAPYHNVRYWLGDFHRRRALTNKEKFNHSHAKLRNVIECAFGVLKARFPILKRMAPFPLGLSDEYFSQYNQVDISLQSNNVQDDDDEEEEEEEDDVDETFSPRLLPQTWKKTKKTFDHFQNKQHLIVIDS
uniref:DDE Tnp4 domain-containing protein n=1 Tax=Lactuca sativa TaxID=4236 RepID=A0A9R1VXQ3_LACSA|nr:hypothetical protein LSAT_V11C400164970 [Lactuca sativa]